jgi:hypothetical protein
MRNTVLVGLVAQVADTHEPTLLHEIGDLLDECGFVGLIGDLGDDDLERPGFCLDDLRFRPGRDPTLPGRIRLTDVLRVVYDATGREIRSLDELHEIIDAGIRMIDEVADAVHELVQVMWRNVRRHTDRDTDRTIQEKLRKFRREHGRLHMYAVEVRNEVHRVLLDIEHHLFRDRGKFRFGIAIRRRTITVERTEVSLPPDERVPKRKVLRHADHGLIHRGVAVRMVLPEHFTDDRRRFPEFRTRAETGRPHRIEDAAMHRLHAVTNIRQGARHDDTHRVVEV